MRCIFLIALLGCSSGEVEDNRGKRALGPVGGLDLGGSDGGEGEGEGEGDSATPADTSPPDTSPPIDTGTDDGGGTDGGDTSPPVDTGEEEPPCLGITSMAPTDAFVVSWGTSTEVTITLTGCATGIFVPGGSMYSGAAEYNATWTSVPAAVDGMGEATLLFTGPESRTYAKEGSMIFTFESDQGDFGPFTLWLTLT